MNNCKWQAEVSALIDGALPSNEVVAVERHLRECADCQLFHEEQTAFSNLFIKASAFQLEPSESIWNGIEVTLKSTPASEAAGSPWWEALSSLLRFPQFGYGVAIALLVLLTGVVSLEFRQPATENGEFLTRLDGFSIETSENPFLQTAVKENPFFTFEAEAPRNPFTDQGVAR